LENSLKRYLERFTALSKLEKRTAHHMEGTMERSTSGFFEMLTLVTLLFSPLLYDFSQWVRQLLGGG
jgi:hypothetical protein